MTPPKSEQPKLKSIISHTLFSTLNERSPPYANEKIYIANADDDPQNILIKAIAQYLQEAYKINQTYTSHLLIKNNIPLGNTHFAHNEKQINEIIEHMYTAIEKLYFNTTVNNAFNKNDKVITAMGIDACFLVAFILTATLLFAFGITTPGFNALLIATVVVAAASILAAAMLRVISDFHESVDYDLNRPSFNGVESMTIGQLESGEQPPGLSLS